MTRLARALGYDGYHAFRSDGHASLRSDRVGYAQQAQALHRRPGGDLFAEVLSTSRENADSVFSSEMLDLIQSCIVPMVRANQIYSLGVRSCYSTAHYLSYVGAMAFDNFIRVPSEPGGIMEQMAASQARRYRCGDFLSSLCGGSG